MRSVTGGEIRQREPSRAHTRGARILFVTATVIMVELVCRAREILRNCGYVLRAVFPTEVLGAGIYSSVIFGGSLVLANVVTYGLWAEASSTRRKCGAERKPSFRASSSISPASLSTIPAARKKAP